MKQPKKPNRSQKEAMSAAYLSDKQWSVVGETEFYLKVVNKETGKMRNIDKFRKGMKI